jgi:hypothetical protein
VTDPAPLPSIFLNVHLRAGSLLEAAPLATAVIQKAGTVASPHSCTYQRPGAYGGQAEGLIYLSAIWRDAPSGLYERLLAALGTGWLPVATYSAAELRSNTIGEGGNSVVPEVVLVRLTEALVGDED